MLGRTLGLSGVFPTLVGGHQGSLGATFLGSQGDSLWGLVSPRCMPAHQHCDLFYPLGWGSAWVCRKLGHALVLRSGTGPWVLSESGACHPLTPVIRLGLRKNRKKDKLPDSLLEAEYIFLGFIATNKQTNKQRHCLESNKTHTARSFEDETRNLWCSSECNRNPEGWGDCILLVKFEKLRFLSISRY